MTRFLLDTNICIRLLNRNRNELLIAKLRSLHPEQVCLSSIVKAELYYGAYRSRRRDENLALLEQFFSAFATLPFDQRCEKIYGQIRAELSHHGNLIGPNDLLIGATALAHKLTLVTHNVREFRRLPDKATELPALRSEVWGREVAPASCRVPFLVYIKDAVLGSSFWELAQKAACPGIKMLW